MATGVTPALTVCLVATRDDDPLQRVLDALAQQHAPGALDVVVVDASPSAAFAALTASRRPPVTVIRAEPNSRRAVLLNAAWRAAAGTAIAFLSPRLVPAAMWADAIGKRLKRGRPLVTAAVQPSAETVGDSGPLSYALWANEWELPVVSAQQMACLRADLERVGGWDEQLPDDLTDVDLALRLVDSGVDPVWARHAVSYYDVAVHPLAEMVQRRQPNRSVSALLAAHPRARARLLVGGIFWHRRHAEAMLAVAAVLLSRCDRRAALLAVPWLHERLHLTPAAGGLRRRWFVLPGVFAFDLYDALLTTAARLRPPRES